MALAGNESVEGVVAGRAAGEAFVDEYALVPMYLVEVSAGHGATVESERAVARLAFRRDWLDEIGVRANEIATVMASGDSMEPTIRDGDVLLVDTAHRQVVKDAIYVVRQDSLLFVKRLQRLYDGSLRISSDNQAYASETVPKRDLDWLEIIGRVVWSGGRL
jgi:phage repressor protein C with HTH and peptisase S24 domain